MIKEFKLTSEYITLGQFLKEESIISSGGQAKWYLQEIQFYWMGSKNKDAARNCALVTSLK